MSNKKESLLMIDVIILCTLEGLMQITYKDKKWAMPSIPWLMTHLRISQATAYRSMKKLISRGYVTKDYIIYNGQKTTGYIVNTKQITEECNKLLKNSDNPNDKEFDPFTIQSKAMFTKLKYLYLILLDN